LPANFTYTAANAGVQSFTVTFKTAGTQSLTATDTGTGSIHGTESGINVAAVSLDEMYQDETGDPVPGDPIPGLPQDGRAAVAVALLSDEPPDLLTGTFEGDADVVVPRPAAARLPRGLSAQLSAAVFSNPEYQAGADEQPSVSAAALVAVMAIYGRSLSRRPDDRDRRRPGHSSFRHAWADPKGG
jgi:hypothetical protein